MPMTTATADPNTVTDRWWEDGRNVSLLAQWYCGKIPAYATGRLLPPVETVVEIYERPWDVGYLWRAFQADLDTITMLLQQ